MITKQELKKLYDPKSAFGNEQLIQAVKEAEAEREAKKEEKRQSAILH